MLNLIIDLTFNWLKYAKQNTKLWLSCLLLSIPLCLILNISNIHSQFLSADYTAINNIHNIKQVYLSDTQNDLPVDEYIFDEITVLHQDLVGVFERSIDLSLKLSVNHGNEPVKVSFISGGYKQLGIIPALGSFNQLDFPKQGSALSAAISYSFWHTHFKGASDIIGKQLVVNHKSINIVAVMPKEFKSFKRAYEPKLVIPYSQLKRILPQESSLTPDTFTYILGNIKNKKLFLIFLNKHLQNEMFIFDNTKLKFSDGIGVNPTHFNKIIKRLNLLQLLYYILLLFSFIAFCAFYCAESIKKQQEETIRKLCGANNKHIFVQQVIDTVLTSLLLIIVMCALYPLSDRISAILLPSLNQLNSYFSLFTLAVFYIAIITFLSALSYFQRRWVHSSIGRGQSATTSEKVQVFSLLSLLTSLAITSVYISSLVIYSQINLNNKSMGFNADNILIASFSFPQSPSEAFNANNSAQQLIQQLNSLPIIEEVSLSSAPPLSDRSGFSAWYTVTGQAISSGKSASTASHRVSPHYFKTIGAKLISGQSVQWQQYQNIVVNSALWNQYFAGTELSQAYLLAQFDTGKVKHKVVGVVNDIYNEGADTPVQPTVYNVISALTGFETIIIRTHAPITQVENELQTAVKALSVNFNDLSLTPLSSLVKNEQAPRNALLIITVVCSSILLLSAFLYNYSSIKQLTAKSSTELALRRAMGARSYQICYLFLKLFFTAFVITHIVIIALFFTQHEKLQTFLFQQSVFDLNTILTVHLVILLTVICIIAIEIKKTLNNSWNNLT